MTRRELIYKNVVIKDGENWRLSSFLMGEKDNHEHRVLEGIDNSIFTPEELTKLDRWNPVLDFPKDFQEQLDSPDDATRDMARTAFIYTVKQKIQELL